MDNKDGGRIPGFTASSSLYKSRRAYSGGITDGEGGALLQGEIHPAAFYCSCFTLWTTLPGPFGHSLEWPQQICHCILEPTTNPQILSPDPITNPLNPVNIPSPVGTVG